MQITLSSLVLLVMDIRYESVETKTWITWGGGRFSRLKDRDRERENTEKKIVLWSSNLRIRRKQFQFQTCGGLPFPLNDCKDASWNAANSIVRQRETLIVLFNFKYWLKLLFLAIIIIIKEYSSSSFVLNNTLVNFFFSSCSSQKVSSFCFTSKPDIEIERERVREETSWEFFH